MIYLLVAIGLAAAYLPYAILTMRRLRQRQPYRADWDW